MVSISPTSTYCSDLEYLIALQSDDEAGSQLRRSQRLREKKSANDALESAAVAATENRAGSPQLFAEIDEECSQLAQTLPIHLVTPNTSNGALGKTLKTELTNSELKKRRIRPAPRKRGRSKKLTDKTQAVTTQCEPLPAPVGSFQQSSKASAVPRKSKPKSRTRRVRSKSNVKSMQSPQLEQKSCVKPQPVLISKACVKRDSAGSTMSNPVAAVIIPRESAVITNSTQSYSYQCMNLTQTLLPERYPAHFIHQLPSEPKYATGTILSGELQRVSSAVIINESNKMSDTISTDSEKLSPSPPNVESWGSRTPSLSESLTEVFGTRRIRDALNIALPRQYRVQESQLPDIASMLGVKVERLRDALELTERLTLADFSSDDKVELVEKLTTKSCKIVG